MLFCVHNYILLLCVLNKYSSDVEQVENLAALRGLPKLDKNKKDPAVAKMPSADSDVLRPLSNTTITPIRILKVAKDKKVPQNRKFINSDDHGVINGDLLLHLHAGVRFPNGTLGLVINPSPEILSKRMPTRDTKCQIEDKKTGDQTITYNVARMVRTGVRKVNKSNKSPRILCMVYTHSGSHSRVQAIVNT